MFTSAKFPADDDDMHLGEISLLLKWGRFENNKRAPYFCNEARGWLLQTNKKGHKTAELKLGKPNKNPGCQKVHEMGSNDIEEHLI